MKRTLLLIVTAALFFTGNASAQVPGAKAVTSVIPKVMFGIKVGADFSGLSGDAWKQTYKGGVVGGLFLGLHGKRFGVQAEGLVRSAKFDVNDPQGDMYVTSVNLDVPVMAEVKIIPRLWFQVGPQFSDVISEKDNNLGATKNVLKTTNFGGVVGLQAVLPLHLVASARYIIGLTDMNGHAPGVTDEAWKNREFQLSIGFRFL